MPSWKTTCALVGGLVAGCGGVAPDGGAPLPGELSEAPMAPHVLPVRGAVAPAAEFSRWPGSGAASVDGGPAPDAGLDAGFKDAGVDAGKDAGPTGNGILFHGGPVLTAAKNVYFIWYGNWSGNTATTLLPFFAQHLGGSPYFNVNTTYSSSTGVAVSGAVTYVGSSADAYSQGASIGDGQVGAIVASALVNKRLATDPNGVYFVLASADVNETSGFCTRYCGWHSAGTLGTTVVKYAFVGNPARCPTACAAQATSPNGNAGADAMVSILAHELEEATTDPQLSAWYDTAGNENADKCAWSFGPVTVGAGGSKSNVVLGGKPFLIQQNWVNASGGFCAMHYP